VGIAFVMPVAGEIDIATRPLPTAALFDACGLVG
jgi:hypothetical protein